jgi:ubiquinone/menaquinone biosynthesis C-methylase UbiE
VSDGRIAGMRWQLDELSFAGDEHLDPAFVERFDRKQGHPDAGPDLEVLLAEGLGPSSTVVDLAAGTGQFALPAAAYFGAVVAVDVSPAMVAYLTTAARDMSNVEVVRGGFLSYRHEGPPADAVYTRHGLHQLPDFWKAIALDRIAGMLRPGGILRVRDLIYDFAPGEAERAFEGWFAGAASDPADGYTAEDYAQHIRTEHSTFRWLFEPMMVAAGFEIVDVEYRSRLYGSYTCRRSST